MITGHQPKPASTLTGKNLRILLVLILFAILASVNQPVHAAGPWYVTPGGNDSNSCLSPGSPCATINAAIGMASASDTIYVAEGIYTGSENQVVLVDKSVTLSGGWDSGFTSQMGYSTIDGQDMRRGVTIAPGTETTIERFDITRGYSAFRGGGVYNQGDLMLTNSSVTYCLAVNDFGGGIASDSDIYIYQSTIANNTSTHEGGGIGAFLGTMTIDQTTISNNTSGMSGSSGYGGGAGIANHSETVIRNSAVINNHILGYFNGSAIFNEATLSIENSTISGNTGGSGGGAIYSGYYGNVNLFNVTITNNYYRGINNEGSTTRIANSIITGNGTDLYNYPYFPGIIESLGYNLIGTYQEFTPAATDLIVASANLKPPTGSPAYLPLTRFSRAIDNGNPAGCQDHLGSILATDQRGSNRNGRCDSGSFEYYPAEDTYSYLCLPSVSTPCDLFRDDFSNPASGWPATNIENVLYEYRDSEYRILVRPQNYFAAARPGFAATDYMVSVDLRNSNGRFGSYGIAFGISQDWNRLYSLEISPNGVFGIYRYDYETITTLAQASSPVIHQGTATNHISVKFEASHIYAYANGQLLADVYDAWYKGSLYIGLLAVSYDQSNLDLRFDNFEIEGINCGSPYASVNGGMDKSIEIDIDPIRAEKNQKKQPANLLPTSQARQTRDAEIQPRLKELLRLP